MCPPHNIINSHGSWFTTRLCCVPCCYIVCLQLVNCTYTTSRYEFFLFSTNMIKGIDSFRYISTRFSIWYYICIHGYRCIISQMRGLSKTLVAWRKFLIKVLFKRPFVVDKESFVSNLLVNRGNILFQCIIWFLFWPFV